MAKQAGDGCRCCVCMNCLRFVLKSLRRIWFENCLLDLVIIFTEIEFVNGEVHAIFHRRQSKLIPSGVAHTQPGFIV
jgi:hypothetical protein